MFMLSIDEWIKDDSLEAVKLKPEHRSRWRYSL
jgi:hypothetical protein